MSDEPGEPPVEPPEQQSEPGADGGAAPSPFDPLAELGAVQLDLQRSETRRIAASLCGYRVAMDDALGAFGPRSDDRGGPFARSFLLEAGSTRTASATTTRAPPG